MPDEPRPASLSPREATGAFSTSPGRLERAVVLVLLVVVVCLAVGVPLAATLNGGPDAYTKIARSYPGAFTGAATTVLRSVADVASAATVGALVWLLLLGRTDFRKSGSGRVVEVGDWFTIKLLRQAAGLWMLAGAGSVVFEAADSNGLAITQFVNPQALRFALTSGDFARAWMVSTAAAFLIWLVANFAASWTSYLVALWAAVVGSLAPVVVGQVLVGPDHDFGGDAAVVQTIAAQILLGVILVVALRLVAGRAALPVRAQTPALWRAAWLGLAVIVCAELVITWFKLAGSPLTGTATGRFALARLLALAVLALALGLAHRTRARPAGPVVAVLVAATGVFLVCGVAMTRISPPQFFVPTSISQILLGFDVDAAPSFAVLTTHWRPNVLFCTLAATALLTYAAVLWRLQRRGERWPVLRTVAWVTGWAVVVIATSSGFGKYSGPDFAVHMGVHMTLNMMAPVLIVLGGPITLALRALPASHSMAGEEGSPGLREKLVSVLGSRFLRLLYHPLLVFGLYIGSYYGLYMTGVFGNVMRFHWAHQLMNLHFLVAGCLYFGLVIGVDPTPRKLPHIAKLGFLMAAMPFHAFFGVILMSSNTVVAETFYRYLDLPWATDLANTQKIAGGVAWAGGEIPLLIVAIVLALQWAIQDNKEARRIDRHLDSGLDDAHDAYNAMLQRLARHHHPDGTGDLAGGDHRSNTPQPIQDSSQPSRVQP